MRKNPYVLSSKTVSQMPMLDMPRFFTYTKTDKSYIARSRPEIKHLWEGGPGC